jgi:hypothetical protein
MTQEAEGNDGKLYFSSSFPRPAFHGAFRCHRELNCRVPRHLVFGNGKSLGGIDFDALIERVFVIFWRTVLH